MPRSEISFKIESVLWDISSYGLMASVIIWAMLWVGSVVYTFA